MNRLHDCLLMIEHFGWKKELGAKAAALFDNLKEYSLDKTDTDLTEEDWKVVSLVDKILQEKMNKRKPKDFDNN